MRWVKSPVSRREREPVREPEPVEPDKGLQLLGWPTFDYRAVLPASAVHPAPLPPPHPEVLN